MAYSHDVVAHNWAHQTGRKRRGFNVFYEGATIYSYGHHFPIAKHVVTPSGERVVVMTRDSYSISTSKHISIVWRAASHLPMVELSTVPNYDITRADIIDELRRIKASLPEMCAQGETCEAPHWVAASRYGGGGGATQPAHGPVADRRGPA